MMTPQQQAAVTRIYEAVETDGLGPVSVYEGTAGDDDVILLFDNDTQVVAVDPAGELTSGHIAVERPGDDARGWQVGWDPES